MALDILMLNSAGSIGGAERVILGQCAYLRSHRPELRVALLTLSDGPLIAHARGLGVDAAVAPLPGRLARLGDSGIDSPLAALRLGGEALAALPALRPYLAGLEREVRRRAPRILHSHGYKAHLASALVSPGPGVRRLWHLHDFLSPRPVMGAALRLLRQRMDLGIAISGAVAADARAVLAGRPIETVFNGVDVERFRPGAGDGAGLDARAGLPPAPAGTVRIGLVATYARWKGQPLFLEAARRVLGRGGPPVRFFVIGGPVYQTARSQFSLEELRALAASLGVGAEVGFVPFLESVQEAYRALDVVVHASTRPEPFGLTIAEAMACGRAVVVSADGGARELISDGEDALGFPPSDPGALTDCIRRLVDAPELRARLGANARRSAASRFPLEAMGKRLAEVYDSVSIGAAG